MSEPLKYFLQSPDDRSRVDGSIQCNIVNHFYPISSLPQADVVIVPVSFWHDFKFNPQIWEIGTFKKPWVLIDFLEYEWCYQNEKTETHLFGKNTESCRWLNPHWEPFDTWIKDHPPIMYFKRELLAKNVSDRVKPIEWLCYLPERPYVGEDEFNKRPLEVFSSWGYSNPMRPKLHGDIFHAMNNGIGVISEASQYEQYMRDHPHARVWMSVFSPWYSRVPIADLLFYQRQAKLTVSLPGCGWKCFRHAEAPCESIMALPKDDLAWSYPWEDGVNCIRLDPTIGKEHGVTKFAENKAPSVFDSLEAATHRTDLYSIYVRSQETIARYRGASYVQNYMMPLIEGALGATP